MQNSGCQLISKLHQAGVRQGDTVAIRSENSTPFAQIVYSCWQLGSVVIPISTRYPSRRVMSILDDFSVRTFFTSGDPNTVATKTDSFFIDDFVGSGSVDWTPTPFDKNQFDFQVNASIILTSGSSAKPKAVLHTLGNHYHSALGAHDNIPFGPGDKWLASLPMYHISGFSLISRALLHGGTLVCPPPKQPLAEAIQQYDVTHLSLVPTQLIQLLEDSDCIRKLKALTAILLGGASLPLNLLQRAASLDLPIYRTYGSTEMASQITTTSRQDCRGVSNSVGCPLKYRQVKLTPEGEIWVKGRTLFRGYVSKNGLVSGVDGNGFFPTGDMGFFDGENQLYLAGRKDLMFISGGENIHPEEIEQAIEGMESVEQVVVVPVEDARFGKRPVAFIKTNKGMRFDRIRANEVLQGRLEKFKVPDSFLPWPQDFGSFLKPARKEFRVRATEMINEVTPEHF